MSTLTKERPAGDRSRVGRITSGALLGAAMFVVAGLGDHLVFGVTPVGARTIDVLGGLALGALLLVPSFLILSALIQRLVVPVVVARAAGAARLALFGVLFLAAEGLWSIVVYHVDPGYSLNRQHLIEYAAGIPPLAALAWWIVYRKVRAPRSRWAPAAIGVLWIAFFVGVAGWLPALYPAGTALHLAHGGVALCVALAALATGVAVERAASLGHRTVALSVVACLAILAGLHVSRFRAHYAARDAVARGGRIARTTARYTQFLLFPRGHGLRALAARAPRAPAEALRAELPPEQPDLWSSLAARRPTGLVIFTVDATRADAVRSRDGIIFERHHSPAPGTREALTSLFTGKRFWEQPQPSLFDHLKSSGFQTIAVGYATGSNQYVQNGTGGSAFTTIAPRPADTEHAMAPALTDALLEKLDGVGDRPFVAWVHHLDPHAPYDPPGSSAWERYLGEVARTEAEIDRAIAGLAARGLADRTAVVISADHGEHFGEHGMHHHNMALYDEVIRVPLMIIPPGPPMRARVHQATSGTDLPEMLLSWLGVTPDRGAPALFRRVEDRPLFAFVAMQPHPTRPVGVASVIRGRFKLIYELRTRAAELYDLGADPGELTNLVDERADVAAALAADLLAELERSGAAVD